MSIAKSTRRWRAAPAAALLAAAALVTVTAAPAGAQQSEGVLEASAFGGTITLAGQDVLPPTPSAAASLGDPDASESLVALPVEPVALAGVVTADAAVHPTADIPSSLTVVSQDLEGPYNAAAVGEVADANVLIDVAGEGISILTADAVRAEAVAVCTDGGVDYSANSETINLKVAGTDVPLNGPLDQVLGAVNDLLLQTTLDQVVSIERNVVTEIDGGGIAVDALVVTVLSAADDLVQVRLAHAEVSGVNCAGVQCADGVDNDGDNVADEADPGCHTDGDANNPDSFDPTDNSEGPQCADGVDNDADAAVDAADPGCHTDGDAGDGDNTFDPTDETEGPQCSDVVDNDGDGVADAADSGCHDDGNANNPDSYNPDDETEGDGASVSEAVQGNLPATGGNAAGTAGLASVMAAAALGIVTMRRRLG